MKQKVAIEIISSLLILLFVYAASSKLIDYNEFKVQLKNSGWLSPFAGIIAWLIPAIELVISLILMVKDTRVVGLYASLILLIIFTIYISGMLLSGQHLPCSCGGVIQSLSWKQHLLFNSFFIILSSSGIVLERKIKSGSNKAT